MFVLFLWFNAASFAILPEAPNMGDKEVRNVDMQNEREKKQSRDKGMRERKKERERERGREREIERER